MKKAIKKYFPSDRKRWKMYLVYTLPIILSSILFALNSFVDNFMVGQVSGGLDALFAANSWTSIIFGIYMGIAIAGSILMSQYYYSGHLEKAKEIARLRFVLNLFLTLFFVVFALVMPERMIRVFAKRGVNQTSQTYDLIVQEGAEYLRIITVSWIFTAIVFNAVNIYREQGYTKIVLVATIFALSSNITLNALALFVFDFGISGIALATVASRIVTLSFIFTHHIVKKTILALNPLSWFKISNVVLKAFFSRSLSIIFTASTMIFITLRNILYNTGFPLGHIAPNVSAGTILGLTIAILNIFVTTFNAIGAASARFVGGELGKGNIAQAKSNAKELKGFLTTIALFLSLSLFALSFLVPSLNFLVSGQHGNRAIILQNVQYSLWPLALLYPWWIWFRTGNRTMLMGGRVNLLSTIDTITAGPLQLGWLAIVMTVIVPATGMSFPIAYFIFFLSDLPRGACFEILFYKMNWAHSITKETASADQASGSTTEMRVKSE